MLHFAAKLAYLQISVSSTMHPLEVGLLKVLPCLFLCREFNLHDGLFAGQSSGVRWSSVAFRPVRWPLVVPGCDTPG